MTHYRHFFFDRYIWNRARQTLTLHYRFDGALTLSERFRFDFPLSEGLDDDLLAIVFETLFFMAGVSYYKLFLADEIVINQGNLDSEGAAFFNRTYQRGLGEYFYVNKMDPKTPINFPVTASKLATASFNQVKGQLVAIGGGKDSLVAAEMLRSLEPTIWTLGHRQQLTPLMERIALPSLWVERRLDPKLGALNASGAYNGHIPISAIFASVGAAVAALSGKQDIVVANESSASDPSLTYQGVSINHQYSKSLDFEVDFQRYLRHRLGDRIRYYSLLRPYSELRIAELFAPSFDRYKDVFSSCNRAFTQTSDHIFWCGECAKCAFAFLILTPFIKRTELESLWGGKNLLLDPSLTKTYRQLLGIEGDKPLDCVGEVKESRSAWLMAEQQYPELASYKFEVPKDYNWRRFANHAIPADILPYLPNPDR